MSSRWMYCIAGIALAVAGLPSAAVPVAAETLIYDIPFEKAMSWSGVMLPYGADSYLDWVIAEGGKPATQMSGKPAGAGKPGKALRITSALRERAATSEIRTLMFNHEPGTSARISLDVKPITHPKGSRFMLRWFDGYVCAETFERIPDEPLAPFPPPPYERSVAMEKPEWDHLDLRTPSLEHTVLTIAIMIEQPPDPDKEEQDEFIDYLLDNLRVEVTPLSQYMDPGFDWHGKGGGTMTNWRWTTAGAHVDWCDFMDELTTVWEWDETISFTLESFRDSGSRLLHVKHNYEHETSQVSVGGVGTISLMRDHPGNVPASWGVRQTVSYAALGLGPDDDAHIKVRIKYTLDDHARMGRACLQVGCDPRGGILTEDALWSDRHYGVNWRDKQWSTKTLEFDRPKGALALTVFFRIGDGLARKDGSIVATVYGSRAIADWIVVKATKR